MSPSDSARDDLAYMRALVETPGNFQKSFGQTYFASGLCYGVQMLLHAAQSLGLIPQNETLGLLIGFGPTVVFLGLMTWIIARDRATRRPAGGAVAKAIGSMLGAVGIANLVLVFVIGIVAWQQQSIMTWLIYPCTVMVLQGAVWLSIFALRRRAWFGVVAVGWFVTAAAMAVGVAYENMPFFIGITGLGFLVFMVIPGWILMRQGRTA